MYFLHYQLQARIKKENEEVKWKKKYISCCSHLKLCISEFHHQHCHWCCMTAAFLVATRGQSHVDMFSSTTKRFYCTVISCTALHTCMLFNYRHCVIKSWWNCFGLQRPLGLHLWETLEFLMCRWGCSSGSDAHVRPDPWGQADSQKSTGLLYSVSSEKLTSFPPCWRGPPGLPEATTLKWNC